MGRFTLDTSTVSKALVVPTGGNATIDARSAWEFENQSGTLGTNYNGSVLYASVGGDVAVIMPGVFSAMGTVTQLNSNNIYGANPTYRTLSSGNGYVTGNNIATTCVSTVPHSPGTEPTGLTVDITVTLPTATLSNAGTGYSAGAIDSVTSGGQGTGIEGTVTVNAGAVTAFTFTNGGINYNPGDVITLIQAGSGDNATITLVSAPNGVVDTIAINQPGVNYSAGDIITVAQAGSGLNATRSVLQAKDLAPTAAANAVVFKGVVTGSILPVAVDYVVTAGTGAAVELIACK